MFKKFNNLSNAERFVDFVYMYVHRYISFIKLTKNNLETQLTLLFLQIVMLLKLSVKNS